LSLNSKDSANSNSIATILIIALVFLLAVLLLLALPWPHLIYDPAPPDIFQITRINYYLASDGINYVGFVSIANTESKDYRNRYIRVSTYVNDKLANCHIPTLNNDLFISQAVHTGVTRLHGVGTWGDKDYATSVWPAHSEISIEYKKGTLRPGDRVTLEFFDTTTNQLLSRDTYPDTIDNTKRLMRLYLNRQGV